MLRLGVVQVICAFLIVDFVLAQNLLENEYNCKRQGYKCKRGQGICRNLKCECNENFRGYDCSIPAGQLGCVTDVCQNNGTCYTSEGEAKCLCPVTHLGDTCEKRADTWECLGTEMKVKLMIPSAFSGRAYGLNSETNCSFTVVDSTEVPGYKEATHTFPFDDSICGARRLTDNPSPGDITYISAMVLGYNKMIQTQHDRIITLNCTHPASNVSLEADMDSNVNERGNLTKNVDKKMYHPVRINFLNEHEEPLTKSLFVGERFSNIVYLISTEVYSALLIDRCIATDSATGKELDIVEQGCPTSVGESVMQDPPGQVKTTYLPSGHTVEVPAVSLKMFGFKFYSQSKGASQVYISCVVKICKEEDKLACEIPDCSGDIAPAETGQSVRRRRSAEDSLVNGNSTAEQTVSSVFTVTEERTTIEELKTAPQPEVDCFRSKEIVIVIIVMSALVLIMLIACAILACLIIRSRGKVRKIIKQNSDTGFHIPRAKITT